MATVDIFIQDLVLLGLVKLLPTVEVTVVAEKAYRNLHPQQKTL